MSTRVVRPVKFTEVEIHTDQSTLREAGQVRKRGGERYRIVGVQTHTVHVSTTGRTHYTQIVDYSQMASRP